MQVDPIQLHSQNTLMNDYRQNKEEIMKFFEYLPFTDLNQRMKDLGGYNFEREKLTQVLHTMNEKWVFRIAYIRMNDFSLAIFTNKFVTDMDSLHLLLTTNHTGSILCNYHILHLLLHGYTLLSSNRITSPLHL